MKKYIIICVNPLGEEDIVERFETEKEAWEWADAYYNFIPECDFYVAQIL